MVDGGEGEGELINSFGGEVPIVPSPMLIDEVNATTQSASTGSILLIMEAQKNAIEHLSFGHVF